MISFSPEVVPALVPRRRLFAGGVQDVADDDVYGRGSKSEIVAQGRDDLFLDVEGHVMDGPVIVHRDGQVHAVVDAMFAELRHQPLDLNGRALGGQFVLAIDLIVQMLSSM